MGCRPRSEHATAGSCYAGAARAVAAGLGAIAPHHLDGQQWHSCRSGPGQTRAGEVLHGTLHSSLTLLLLDSRLLLPYWIDVAETPNSRDVPS